MTNRITRHNRIRAKVKGTSERPRLAVYKSNRYLEAQIIDDTKGRTLVSAKMKDGKELGKDIATRAIKSGIKQVVFDRGGFRYIGQIAQVADSAREAGLTF